MGNDTCTYRLKCESLKLSGHTCSYCLPIILEHVLIFSKIPFASVVSSRSKPREETGEVGDAVSLLLLSQPRPQHLPPPLLKDRDPERGEDIQ